MSVLIATFPETKEIAKKVARALKAEYTEIFAEDFPDSEFHLALKKNPKNKTVIIFNSICKDPDEKLIETLLVGGIARDYKAKEVILMATYFPYLRQDKHFIKYDSFSSNHIIKLFSNFDKIITIDPHLHRIKHMRDWASKATSISAKELIADYIAKRFKGDFTILGPDEESAQWNKPIAKKLGEEVVILKKTRLSSTHITQKENNNQKFKNNVIIIDDIISTGKTIAGALALAKKQGAKNLFCIGIHGLLVNNAEKLITKHAELITTNTIPNHHSKIDVSPIIIQELKKLGY
ncbi:MAG: ribose-phosphate diphosphokinase [Nanoarchaeota archaeon]